MTWTFDGVLLPSGEQGRLEVSSHPPGGPPAAAARAGQFLAPSGRYFTGLHAPVGDDDLLAAVEAELDAGSTWLKLVGDFPRVEDGRLVGEAAGTLVTYDADPREQPAVLAAPVAVVVHGRRVRCPAG